jgi:hypothetical protein
MLGSLLTLDPMQPKSPVEAPTSAEGHPVVFASRALLVLGVYQLITGLAGTALIIVTWHKLPSAVPFGSLVLASMPFGVLSTAGGLLIRRTALGLRWTVVAQLMQVFSFSLPLGVWMFSAGPYLNVSAWRGSLHFAAGVDLSLFAGRFAASDEQFVTANLVPLIIVLALWIFLDSQTWRMRSTSEAE